MNWFKKVLPEFRAVSAEFVGQPILYVEIGCWTGDSADWCCRNVLTHPDARGVGIDDYAPDWKRDQEKINEIKRAAAERLAAHGDKWSWRYDKSQHVLADYDAFGGRSIDFLYVDGSHNAHDVLLDFAYAWQHLRKGSVILFDDVGIGARQTTKDGLPRVAEGLLAINSAFSLFVEEVPTGGGRQAALRVVKRPVVGELLLTGRSSRRIFMRKDL